MVALFWLRLYLPLLRADMPQAPKNMAGFKELAFAGTALAQLGDTSPLDLRAGGVVGNDRRRAMHDSLRAACETIHRMPAAHLTYNDNRSDGTTGYSRSSAVSRGCPTTLDWTATTSGVSASYPCPSTSGGPCSASDLEDVFVALGLQRLRLSNDQQIPEWGGPD